MKGSFVFPVFLALFWLVSQVGRAETSGDGKGEILRLVSGNVTLEIDSGHGARILSFCWNGKELLFTNRGRNSGSTFWPSPQAAWPWPGNWPPPASFDLLPYSLSYSNLSNSLVLTGLPQKDLGLTPRKIFTLRSSANAISIEYGLRNDTETNVLWAPWEVTRVPKTSLLFFPKGGDYTGKKEGFKPALETENQVWIQNSGANGKLFRDGAEGWLACAYDGMLFVKIFPDIPQSQFAPVESEVEIYAGGNYYELENQGAYASISPGAWLTWSVTWRATHIPGTVTNAAGSQSLMDFAREVAK